MCRSAVAWKYVLFVASLLPIAGPAPAYEQEVMDLARHLAEQLHAKQSRAVAVVDFTDLRGEANELGRFLAEELSISLIEAAGGRFQVIDRTRLAVVFAEHQLAASGLIAPEQAKRLGQLVGADVLVSATMTPFGESVRLTVKALDTETAALSATSRGNVPRTEAIEILINRGLGARPDGAGGTGTTRRDERVEPVSAKSFTFELQGCALSGTSVECLILVQNQVADRLLAVTDSSRLFDDLGNEYPPRSLRIANTDMAGSQVGRVRVRVRTFRSDRWGEDGVEKAVIQGVVTPLELTFEEVDLQSARVSLLQLSLIADQTRFEVRFRDFPFSAGGR